MKHSVKEHKTKNGARVLCIDIPGITSCEIAIAVRSGYRFSMHNHPENYEVPHILEHLVFDGSRSHPTSDELQDIFSRGGGENNGFTTPYHNIFAFHTRTANLRDTLEAAIDMVYFPLLTQQSLDEEREVIRNEHFERMGDFVSNASLLSLQQACPEAFLTPPQQLEVLDTPSLEDIQLYHKKYYTQKNSQFVIAADFHAIKQSDVISLIEGALHTVPAGKQFDFPRFEIQPSTGQLHLEPIAKSLQDSTISYNFIQSGSATYNERLTLQLFTHLASGMKSYSVNHILRKKGLTYGLDCSAAGSLESYGIELNLTTKNEKVASVLAHALDGLKTLANRGISESQFENAKQEMIGGLEDATNSPDSIMGWYLEDYLVEGILRSPEEDARALHKLDQTEVLKMAAKTLDYAHLYGAVFTSMPIRVGGAVILINEAILRDGNPLSDKLIDESTTLLNTAVGRGFRMGTYIALVVLGAAFTMPLIDLLHTQNIAHLTYITFGWWMLAAILWWVAMLVNTSLQKIDELRRDLLYFGLWCTLMIGLSVGFEWNTFTHLTAVGWAHAFIIVTCISFLVFPNIGTALRLLRRKNTAQSSGN